MIIATSGGYDPVHIGHIESFEEAKKLGGKLVIILNSDEFLKKKKGYFFMEYAERKRIIESLWMVDEVIPCIDEDMTVCETLRQLKPDVFAKGGDRFNSEIPEAKVCKELGIRVVDGLGAKVQSSSELVERARQYE